jgi:hypothetical protein
VKDLAARIKRSARCGALAALPAAIFPAGDAWAQSSACEQLKATLSARIEASGVRDYTLEAVPADTPMPPGARVIGTCDAGKTRMLYRRGGGTPLPAVAPVAARPAPVPKPSAASESRVQVQATPAPSVDVVAADRTPPPAPAPTPIAAAPPPVVQAVEEVPTPVARLPETDSAPTISLAQRSSDFAAANWKWLLALVLVPVAGGLWAWLAHRSAYDKSGLPRGPRLRA